MRYLSEDDAQRRREREERERRAQCIKLTAAVWLDPDDPATRLLVEAPEFEEIFREAANGTFVLRDNVGLQAVHKLSDLMAQVECAAEVETEVRDFEDEFRPEDTPSGEADTELRGSNPHRSSGLWFD